MSRFKAYLNESNKDLGHALGLLLASYQDFKPIAKSNGISLDELGKALERVHLQVIERERNK